MKQYRLRAQHQRRPSAKDGLNRLPIQGVEFVGSNIVESSADFSKWSAFVEEVHAGDGYCVADRTTAEDLANGVMRIDLEAAPIHPVEGYDDEEGADEESDESSDEESGEDSGEDSVGQSESTVLIPATARRRGRPTKERGV